MHQTCVLGLLFKSHHFQINSSYTVYMWTGKKKFKTPGVDANFLWKQRKKIYVFKWKWTRGWGPSSLIWHNVILYVRSFQSLLSVRMKSNMPCWLVIVFVLESQHFSHSCCTLFMNSKWNTYRGMNWKCRGAGRGHFLVNHSSLGSRS